MDYEDFLSRMRQKGYENMTNALLELQKHLGIEVSQVTK